jgi:thiopeptide-type bacteriocin biosynthesis protein
MVDRAAHGSAWVSSHIFYQDDLDRLLVHVVAPLVDECAASGLARESFFLRYWDGGHHLRLRVLPVPGVRRADVQRLISERFGGYLARHPSPDRLSQQEYARSARVLARRENVPVWSARLHPNNSVSFIAYRREHDRYGHGAAIAAVERHFAESSRIALRVVTMGASADQRAAAAAALILVTWFTGEPDPGRLTTWLAGRDKDKDKDLPDLGRADHKPLAACAGRHPVHMVDLARRMRVLAAAATDLPAEGTLVDWARSIGDVRAALATQIAAGAFTARDDGVLPVLDTCAHLICNRLGVSPATEAALRTLAAQSVAALASEGN